MKFLAVTTFHQKGLEEYGRRMATSFDDHWSRDVELRIYSEGWKELFPFATVIDLEESSDWLVEFKRRHAGLKTDNFRMDVVRFSHKVAALLQADQTTDARYLLWIDADTVTHSDISMEELFRLAPRGEWISWLDRQRAYPECGFYIIDRQHHRHVEMMKRFRDMYANDLFRREREWHDSYLLQQCVLQAGVTTKSISGDGYKTHHPFINGPLGRWMDHMKGRRKEKGRSHGIDLKVARDEEYWK